MTEAPSHDGQKSDGANAPRALMGPAVVSFTVERHREPGPATIASHQGLATTMKQAQRVSGFTLSELMVVLVIIGVLAALIVPNMLDRADDARVTAARTDVNNLIQALKLAERSVEVPIPVCKSRAEGRGRRLQLRRRLHGRWRRQERRHRIVGVSTDQADILKQASLTSPASAPVGPEANVRSRAPLRAL